MADSRIGPDLRERIRGRWPEVCDRLANGEQVGKVFASYGFTRNQCAAFIASEPDCKRMWDVAREASADAFFDQAQEIADNAEGDGKVARVRLQALMWLAAKRNPRTYSDKATLDVNVRTVDLTRIIQDANARLAAAHARPVIEGEVLPAALLELVR